MVPAVFVDLTRCGGAAAGSGLPARLRLSGQLCRNAIGNPGTRSVVGYDGLAPLRYRDRMAAGPPVRIALNIAIDGVLAALAVPLARAMAAPSSDWLHPWWLPVAGAATLLLAGLPFRLPWQFWRFAGIDDLLGVAWSSALGAALLGFVLALTGAASGNPAFPVVLCTDPPGAARHAARGLSPLAPPPRWPARRQLRPRHTVGARRWGGRGHRPVPARAGLGSAAGAAG